MNRTWFLRVLVVAFIWVVVSRLTEIEALARAFLQARWGWLLAAGLIQSLYFLVFAAVYQSAFDTVGVRARIRHILPVVFASMAVSVATRGIGGAMLFVDDASRRGESPGRTAVGMLLSLVADLTAFMLVLVPGIVFLLVFHVLERYEVVAAAILVAIVCALCGVMLIGLWRPDWVRSMLYGLQRIANTIGARFHRAEPCALGVGRPNRGRVRGCDERDRGPSAAPCQDNRHGPRLVPRCDGLARPRGERLGRACCGRTNERKGRSGGRLQSPSHISAEGEDRDGKGDYDRAACHRGLIVSAG